MAHGVQASTDPVGAVEDAFGLLQWLLDGVADGRAFPAVAVALGQMVIGWMSAFAVQAGAVTEDEIMARVRDQLGVHRDAAMFTAITAGMGTAGAPLTSGAGSERISMGTRDPARAVCACGGGGCVSDRRRVAQHESGHAVAHWALGVPFTSVRIGDPDGDGHAVPLPDAAAPVHPLGEVTRPPGTWMSQGRGMLIAACGVIADTQRRGLALDDPDVLALLLGVDDGMVELSDPSTGSVAERAPRAPMVAPGADLEVMSEIMAGIAGGMLGPTVSPPHVIIRLWREAEQFAAQLRPAINAVAAAVLDRGELAGAEVFSLADAAMAGRPRPQVPGLAR